MRRALEAFFLVMVGSVGMLVRSADSAPQASAAIGSLQFGPVIASPASDPRTIVQQLAFRPSGSRTLYLTGFDSDIALRDRVMLPAQRSGQPAVSVPSPWLETGAAIVNRRVLGWLVAFRREGGLADSVVVSPPQASIASVLSGATASLAVRLASDSRFPALAARSPAIAAASRGVLPSAAAWQAAMRQQVESASASAHRHAVASALGSAVVMQVAAIPQQPAAPKPAELDAAMVAAAASYVARMGAPAAESGSVLLTRALPSSEWDRLIALSATSEEARRILSQALADADRVTAAGPAVFRRARSFAEIPTAMVDATALAAGTNRDSRALAMHDCVQADLLRRDGVALALAVRFAGRPAHVACLNQILVEVSAWDPFQRQGWSLTDQSRVLPAGGDGVNMATSWGVVGLVDILSILGDSAPAELRSALERAIRRELGNVVDSWANGRPWYVQSGAVASNQWIDPNAAVVLACLYLRDERLRPVYELAAANLRLSLAAFEQDGAFLEGMSYAQMSLPALFRGVEAMARAGDGRLRAMPFVQNSWRWMLHMQMPGGNLVSSGDSRMSVLPAWATAAPLDSLALAALASGSPDAVPSLRAMFPACGMWASAATYASRLASTQASAAPRIAPWGHYPSQQLVTWRQSWTMPGDQSRDVGVWIKGGTLRERSHGHRDQGQVSLYCGSTPILMERGTPDYSDPAYLSGYASAQGHGIMQVDPVLPANIPVDAPARIVRLGAGGGKVQLDLAGAYRSASSCSRMVEWDAAGSLRIEDLVELREPRPAGTEFYRFHLGASVQPAVVRDASGWTVSWRDASVRLSADVPIEVEVTAARNALCAPFVHHVLSVRSAEPGAAMSLTTEVQVLR